MSGISPSSATLAQARLEKVTRSAPARSRRQTCAIGQPGSDRRHCQHPSTCARQHQGRSQTAASTTLPPADRHWLRYRGRRLGTKHHARPTSIHLPRKVHLRMSTGQGSLRINCFLVRSVTKPITVGPRVRIARHKEAHAIRDAFGKWLTTFVPPRRFVGRLIAVSWPPRPVIRIYCRRKILQNSSREASSHRLTLKFLDKCATDTFCFDPRACPQTSCR